MDVDNIYRYVYGCVSTDNKDDKISFSSLHDVGVWMQETISHLNWLTDSFTTKRILLTENKNVNQIMLYNTNCIA